ncbi:MAG: UDP-N-acetylmuramoyl-L-alanine--D-glutamate ligase [Metallibacterium scheffleri]|uniref:UDP-N-acetylmuramoyl-L-alanine--D-glutamate ligase n=1 Tax=Metallibacterium scheffleri TaxID=993689 RepID=UPI0026F2868F|nr:UDP-N-acetylmuramoyl-L-alanine--D-glutamate ligase [Metallibacterium scheffleri]MCK9368306.1 UDP-N-acetylmuramoyl-L-alanine--D-glutamate ligase [Metallibacterium scheffleri]
MNAPLPRFADLAARRVAVWGYGREGRAALRALARRLPRQPLTLWCSADEATIARAEHPALAVLDVAPDAAALAQFDWVIKSPGISAYRPEIAIAQAQGTRFTSGTALWFGERAEARVVGVTGTKGKSTTSALLAHLARALGWRTALAGNIGLPLLELLDDAAALWVLELSSFQTGEAGPLELGVITNLHEEHLDWHGTPQRYRADKLRLADAACTLLVDAAQPVLLDATATHAARRLYDDAAGWHVAQSAIWRGDRRVFDLARFALPGLHNARNACAALCALEILGGDAVAAAPALARFHGLPHRLQRLGERGGLQWIDDSISTTPEATRAALESLPGAAVTLILGGHERGLDWAPFATWLAACPPHAVIAQGASAARIGESLAAAGVPWRHAADLAAAVDLARTCSALGGVVLLSPGAPSFDQFRDYAARGRRFAELAGFDPSVLAAFGEIAGLGIA